MSTVDADAAVLVVLERMRASLTYRKVLTYEPVVEAGGCLVMTPAHPLYEWWRLVVVDEVTTPGRLDGQCEHLVLEEPGAVAFWTPARGAVLLCRDCMDAELDLIVGSGVCLRCVSLVSETDRRLVRVPLVLPGGRTVELWVSLCGGCLG